MALNGISTEVSGDGSDPVATKLLRRSDKLALAQAKRSDTTIPGYRQLNLLSGSFSAFVNGTGGSILSTESGTNSPAQGHPWTVSAEGVYNYRYNQYWNSNVNFFDTATLLSSAPVVNFNIPSEPTTHSELYLGYFRSDYTGTWTFTLTSDDQSALWLGAYALSGYTMGNASTSATYGNPGVLTISLVEGTLYPLRLMYGNNGGPGSLGLSYSNAMETTTTNYANKLLYNVATNGF